MTLQIEGFNQFLQHSNDIPTNIGVINSNSYAADFNSNTA